jgi:hypothetical protein
MRVDAPRTCPTFAGSQTFLDYSGKVSFSLMIGPCSKNCSGSPSVIEN